jgi:hypothetical protein
MDITIDKNEVDRFPLKKYFGIDETFDSGWGEDLDTINKWGERRGFKTHEDMLLELKKIEIKLGTPSLGENRVTRLKNYLTLDEKLGSVLKEMEAYGAKS